MSKVRTIAVGNERFEIRDDGIPSVFVDIIVESRLMGEIVGISLAALVVDGDVDGDIKPEAVVAARLRMPLPTARVVNSQLSLLIEHAEQRLRGEMAREPATALN